MCWAMTQFSSPSGDSFAPTPGYVPPLRRSFAISHKHERVKWFYNTASILCFFYTHRLIRCLLATEYKLEGYEYCPHRQLNLFLRGCSSHTSSINYLLINSFLSSTSFFVFLFQYEKHYQQQINLIHIKSKLTIRES